jgi:hypothetical protein
MKFSTDEIIEALKINKDEYSNTVDGFDMRSFISDKLDGFYINYDGGNFSNVIYYKTLIIGEKVKGFDDGTIIEYDDPTTEEDKILYDKFESIVLFEKLKTYIQIVSGDINI